MRLPEFLYEKMLLIRKFEQTVDDLFQKGVLRGTTHGCIGQEAIAVGLLQHIDPDHDYITGNHRSHGHVLALGCDPYLLLAELMGKQTGLLHGRGGSQHLKFKNFYSNGITGGMVPVATGMAYCLKIKSSEHIVVTFLGDGAMNEGYVLEALNLAGALQLPILFVLENNQFAMSTYTRAVSSGIFAQRIQGFGLEYHAMQATNVMKIYETGLEYVQHVRCKRTPMFLEFETHRFSGHSKSDKREYIDRTLDQFWAEHDPFTHIESLVSPDAIAHIRDTTQVILREAVNKALHDADPNPEEEYRIDF